VKASNPLQRVSPERYECAEVAAWVRDNGVAWRRGRARLDESGLLVSEVWPGKQAEFPPLEQGEREVVFYNTGQRWKIALEWLIDADLRKGSEYQNSPPHDDSFGTVLMRCLERAREFIGDEPNTSSGMFRGDEPMTEERKQMIKRWKDRTLWQVEGERAANTARTLVTICQRNLSSGFPSPILELAFQAGQAWAELEAIHAAKGFMAMESQRGIGKSDTVKIKLVRQCLEDWRKREKSEPLAKEIFRELHGKIHPKTKRKIKTTANSKVEEVDWTVGKPTGFRAFQKLFQKAKNM